MNQPRPQVRIDALTGIRILAAAGVFLSHASAPAFLPDRARTFMAAGYNGVTLFFILSGFVLALSYADKFNRLDGVTTWNFAVARIARIYPLYLFALLWVMAPGLITTGFDFSMLRHALAVQAWHPDIAVAYAFNGPGWSIGVEFFLYACFPLVILALRRIRHSPVLLLTVAGVAFAFTLGLAWWFTATGRADLPWHDPSSAHRWLYRMPLTRIGDFVIGAVAALLAMSTRPAAWLGRSAQIVGAVMMVLLMQHEPLLFTAWSWDSAYVLPAFLLLWGLAVTPSTGFGRILGSRPMVVLGEASFAFYLLHAALLPRMHIAEPTGWPTWAAMTAFEFVMIMLLAVGAHTIIERPAQRWIRRGLSRRKAQPAEPVTPPEAPSVRAPLPAEPPTRSSEISVV
ncbi:acyltransferase family protein [Cellulomonas chengniuliangii]|uniref:acyltransferase family protein n=1 Tax=Cellulomonas chengniuliangii TaxID=2968084 RepID=UPI001D0F2DBE|nr:acyltransferase [Cellulomonas chengniuliangii]MCC2316941.1 acyltransferase [Cellulomonas chengniuliangii]